MAKSFHQRLGVDFLETFSPVVNLVTIRTVLSIALHHYWDIRQLDVNNAFLNGHLTEKVYMAQPTGMQDSNSRSMFVACTRLYMNSNKHPSLV